LTEVIQAGFWDNVGICAANSSIQMCQRLLMLAENAYIIYFNALSAPQNRISKIMEKEIMSLAQKGEKTQYIITGICTSLVTVFLIIIIPIFLWVIKDKSYVLAIFSDIDTEEIEKVINDCKKLNIKNVKYKYKWLSKYENKPDLFWNKILTEMMKKGITQSQSNSRETLKKSIMNNTSNNNSLKTLTDEQKIERRLLLSEIEYFSIN